MALKGGIFDFYNNATREVYGFAGSVHVSYCWYMTPSSGLDLSSGLYMRCVDYGGGTQRLYIIPLLATFNVYFQQNAVYTAYMGAGAGAYYKREDVAATDRKYDFITYGYHAAAGVRAAVHERVAVLLEMRFQFIMKDAMQEMDISGFNTQAGVEYRL